MDDTKELVMKAGLEHLQAVPEAEAERLFGLSRGTLAHLRKKGGGPRFFKVSKGDRSSVRYLVSELERWVKSRTFASNAERREADRVA
jgi:predicted DNA-binding transcriptional regulator AlpA